MTTYANTIKDILRQIRSSKSQNVDIFVTYFHFSIDLIKVLFDIETDHIVSFVRKIPNRLQLWNPKELNPRPSKVQIHSKA